MDIYQKEYWEKQLKKVKRKTELTSDGMVQLFCETCEKPLYKTYPWQANFETSMYCGECAKKYIKPVPADFGMFAVVEDWGNLVYIRYNSPDSRIEVKTCSFNKKGRYIMIKRKRYYI